MAAPVTNEAFVENNNLREVLKDGVLILLNEKPDGKPAVYKRLSDYFQSLAGGAPAGAAAELKLPNTEGMSEEAAIAALRAFTIQSKEQMATLHKLVEDSEKAVTAVKMGNYKGRKLPLKEGETYTQEEMWATAHGSPFELKFNAYVGDFFYWADKDGNWVNAQGEKVDKPTFQVVGLTKEQRESLEEMEFEISNFG